MNGPRVTEAGAARLTEAGLARITEQYTGATLTQTLAAATLSAAGSVPVLGTLGVTLGAVSLNAEARIRISGVLSASLADAALLAHATTLGRGYGLMRRRRRF